MAEPVNSSVQPETRERLLEAAAEVFAREGFHQATIREICRIAGTNVAAVNYHFRDKEHLYTMVLQHALGAAFKKYPPDMGVSPGDPPEARLRAYIRSFLLRLLEEGRQAWHGPLMSLEMTQPTHGLDQVVEEFVRPLFHRLEAIVGEILGPQATAEEVRDCARSISGQCVIFRHAKPVICRMDPDLKFDSPTIEQLAEHITRFSLAALKALAKGKDEG